MRSILFVLALGLLLAFTLFPFIWLLLTSLKRPVEIFAYPPTFWPRTPTLDNYMSLIAGYDPTRALKIPIVHSFMNSVVIALATAIIVVIAGAMAAYAVVRRRTPWMIAVFVGILVMRTIPRISIAIPLYLLIRRLGLVDTVPGIVLAHITLVLPLAMYMMYSFFQDLPVELEEAAQVDGASRFTTFRRIVLPLAAPGLAVTAILAFVFSYNDFLYALVLVSTERSMTLPVGLSTFIMQYGIAWELLSAAGTLATLPVILFAFFVQRYIVKGLTLGAVKG